LPGASPQFREEGMRKIGLNITASIGLMVCLQTAFATLDSRVARSASRDVDRISVGVLAQADVPAAPATAPPADSKPPAESSPPAVSPTPAPPSPVSPSPAAPAAAEVVRPAPSGPGCALKYMGAEVAGKLKGRKWKEFRQEECGTSTTQAVFPTAVSPKYSGVSQDKARTLTCADQFKVNKATNANGGMKWIEMGGGYYSECVSRLKG
jgi:hypothetical protein